MNGGKLIQDCNGHACYSTHGITDGKVVYEITSTHHQMQYPYNLNNENYDVLYRSETRLSNYYDGDKINIEPIILCGEPEIVSYHIKDKPKCLAIQGHPEMMFDAPVVKMINELIKNLL